MGGPRGLVPVPSRVRCQRLQVPRFWQHRRPTTLHFASPPPDPSTSSKQQPPAARANVVFCSKVIVLPQSILQITRPCLFSLPPFPSNNDMGQETSALDAYTPTVGSRSSVEVVDYRLNTFSPGGSIYFPQSRRSQRNYWMARHIHPSDGQRPQSVLQSLHEWLAMALCHHRRVPCRMPC